MLKFMAVILPVSVAYLIGVAIRNWYGKNFLTETFEHKE